MADQASASTRDLLGKLLGSNSPGQMALYAIVQSMVGAALAPFMEELQQLALSKVPVRPLSPAQLADMVNRHIKDLSSSQSEALLSGVNDERFAALVASSGEPPGVDIISRAFRLGIIPYDSGDSGRPGFIQGVRQSRVYDLWGSVLRDVARAYPTPDLFVQAWLRGQVDEQTARSTFERLGGVPEYFDVTFDVAGRPPSPNEAADMVHRGIVPKSGIGPGVTSYDQAVRESDLKDKWGEALFALTTYVPPPRTVVALVRAGALDDKTALETLQKSGVTAEMAASYVAEAHHTRTATERELAKGDILTLYSEKALSADQASAMLQALHYNQADATFLLELQDFRRELQNVNAAISKFRNLFIAHKIDVNVVVTSLDKLGVDSKQRDELIRTWTLEREAVVKTLTPSEIRKANSLGLLSDEDALARLVAEGYTKDEALLYLKL